MDIVTAVLRATTSDPFTTVAETGTAPSAKRGPKKRGEKHVSSNFCRFPLSRYTHRVAISNDRLQACRDGQVTFSYRDRRDGDRRKEMELPADKFIGRFLLHVLPDRFVRIRHYGFLFSGQRRAKLAEIREQLGSTQPPAAEQEDSLEQWIREVLGIDVEACPSCGDVLLATQLPATRPAIQLCRPNRYPRGPPAESTK